MLKKIRKTSERGQAIILIAAAIVGLVAIVGLMIDGGILLIEYARLKRGIDSASIAAASQFRKGFVGADMVRAGQEFLKFNQSDANVTIYTCRYPGTSWDDTLCAPLGQPQRKLVRITASRYVDFGFMRVIGMNGTWINATAVGEAASIDMVLVLDTSTSMAYETTGSANELNSATATSPGDDPEACNANMGDTSKRCEPMGKVKDAAVGFVDELFFPYDRVALVATTGQGTSGATRNPVLVLPFSDNDTNGVPNTEIQDAIKLLRVFQPDRCPMPLDLNLNHTAPCLLFDPTTNFYVTQACIPNNIGVLDPTDTTPPYDQKLMVGGVVVKDPTTCGPSNIGGGLYQAGYQFASARQNSFWVVIALFGGPANASNPTGHANGLCPGSNNTPTWKLPGGSGFCRDEDDMTSVGWVSPAAWNAAAITAAQAFDWSAYDFTDASRHHFTVDATDPLNPINVYEAGYDADDHARDGADYITSPPDGTTSQGQGATLFSICMGDYCQAYPNRNDPASGELLGRYMALHAGDQYDILGNVTRTANHGLYFYAEDATVVDDVFTEIAENIFTRISQ